MPSSTTLSPNAFRSPETAIAEFLMRPLSAPPLTRPCHAPDTTTDTAFYLVARVQDPAEVGLFRLAAELHQVRIFRRVVVELVEHARGLEAVGAEEHLGREVGFADFERNPGAALA